MQNKQQQQQQKESKWIAKRIRSKEKRQSSLHHFLVDYILKAIVAIAIDVHEKKDLIKKNREPWTKIFRKQNWKRRFLKERFVIIKVNKSITI